MLESGTRYAAPMFQGLKERRGKGGVMRDRRVKRDVEREKGDERVSIARCVIAMRIKRVLYNSVY